MIILFYKLKKNRCQNAKSNNRPIQNKQKQRMILNLQLKYMKRQIFSFIQSKYNVNMIFADLKK